MQLEILDRDQPLPLDEIVDSEDEMENTDEEELDKKLAACIEVLETDLSAKLDGFFEAGDVYKRIGCINHAFHNVVGDGLKVAGARVGNCLERVKYWSTLLYKSGKFFDIVESVFGKEVGRPDQDLFR